MECGISGTKAGNAGNSSAYACSNEAGDAGSDDCIASSTGAYGKTVRNIAPSNADGAATGVTILAGYYDDAGNALLGTAFGSAYLNDACSTVAYGAASA